MLKQPLRVVPRGMVMRILTGRLAGAKWIAGAGIHRCWLGTYEIEKQRALEAFVKPGMVVFDIGAHAGFYSLFFSRLVGRAGCVWSFEPDVQNTGYLLRHVDLNQLRNVTVVAAAVGAAPDLGQFRRGSDSYLGHLAADGDYRVPAMSLDGLLSDPSVPRPDLIKIDVEGGEVAVLAGAFALLRRHRPIVFVALHGARTGTECRQCLEAHGYRLSALAGLPSEVYAIPA
jgi:FkbM family methyltransferase